MQKLFFISGWIDQQNSIDFVTRMFDDINGGAAVTGEIILKM